MIQRKIAQIDNLILEAIQEDGKLQALEVSLEDTSTGAVFTRITAKDTESLVDWLLGEVLLKQKPKEPEVKKPDPKEPDNLSERRVTQGPTKLVGVQTFDLSDQLGKGIAVAKVPGVKFTLPKSVEKEGA